ncbi:hypothetical protein PIB30_009980 [Stylosanthes scabra]|uniref:Uncharacterized protein n=1 Tax=Stylosanthes scabra TaxID=79078 RepID=A0ABU6U421_9FABA|nr:hypothetical protein [Stylosanthes scabra]
MVYTPEPTSHSEQHDMELERPPDPELPDFGSLESDALVEAMEKVEADNMALGGDDEGDEDMESEEEDDEDDEMESEAEDDQRSVPWLFSGTVLSVSNTFIMIVLAWNVRRFANRAIIRTLKEMKRQRRPRITLFFETKCSGSRARDSILAMGFKYFIVEEVVGFVG